MTDSMIIDDQDLRSLVLEVLRKKRDYNVELRLEYIFVEIAEISKSRGLKYTQEINAWSMDNNGAKLHVNLWPRVYDIVWDLIIEGVLRPGNKKLEFTFPHIHLTEYGETVLKDANTPYDPEGFLQRIREKVPSVDPIVMTYVAESAETLRRGCFLSSTITLGCASETVMLLLIQKTEDALNPKDQAAFKAAFAKLLPIKQKNTEYQNQFEKLLKPKLKGRGDFVSQIENGLAYMFGYFRVMRNDAGHPTGSTLSREECASNLAVFPHYLGLLYEFMDWLDANKPI